MKHLLPSEQLPVEPLRIEALRFFFDAFITASPQRSNQQRATSPVAMSKLDGSFSLSFALPVS